MSDDLEFLWFIGIQALQKWKSFLSIEYVSYESKAESPRNVEYFAYGWIPKKSDKTGFKETLSPISLSLSGLSDLGVIISGCFVLKSSSRKDMCLTMPNPSVTIPAL